MGLDLTLVPYEWGAFSYDTFWLGYTRIALRGGGARGFADTLEAFPSVVHPLPPTVRFEWYGDEGTERRTEDPYGMPLTYVHAGDLVKVWPWEAWPAAGAYLRALDPFTPVLLWWH